MKKDNADEDMIVNRNIQVKLPMLVITRFQGMNLVGFNFGINSKQKLIRLR